MRITCARCAASSLATGAIVSTHPSSQSFGQRVSSSNALLAAFFSRKAWSMSRRIGLANTACPHSTGVRECSGSASSFAISAGFIILLRSPGGHGSPTLREQSEYVEGSPPAGAALQEAIHSHRPTGPCGDRRRPPPAADLPHRYQRRRRPVRGSRRGKSRPTRRPHPGAAFPDRGAAIGTPRENPTPASRRLRRSPYPQAGPGYPAVGRRPAVRHQRDRLLPLPSPRSPMYGRRLLHGVEPPPGHLLPLPPPPPPLLYPPPPPTTPRPHTS